MNEPSAVEMHHKTFESIRQTDADGHEFCLYLSGPRKLANGQTYFALQTRRQEHWANQTPDAKESREEIMCIVQENTKEVRDAS